MWSMNNLHVVSNAFFGELTESILIKLIRLINFHTFKFFDFKPSFESKTMLKFLWWGYFVTLFACLNYIFYCKAHLLIFSKSEFHSFADVSISWTFGKRESSSVKTLHIDVIPSGRSFLIIKIKEVLILTLLVLQSSFFSNQTFDHLIILFVHDYQGKYLTFNPISL